MDQQENGVIVLTEKQIVFRNYKAMKLMTEEDQDVTNEELYNQLFYEYIDSDYQNE